MTTGRQFKFLIACFALLTASNCETESTDYGRSCSIELQSIAPNEALPGESIQLEASPLTSVQDTALFVRGVQAEILSVDRTDCDACDECIAEQECSPCGDCDACDAICDTECIETAVFLVPELSPGAAAVTLYNLYGQSESVTLNVLEVDNTADTDAP